MEFEKIGIIPYEAPSDEFKQFFIRKYKTVFRLFQKHWGGATDDILKEQIQTYAEKVAKGVPEEDRPKAMKKYFDVLNLMMLFDRESISEEEFVQEWMNIAFEDQERRRKMLINFKPLVSHGFYAVDSNKDGVIDFTEFEKWYKVRSINHDTMDLVFKAIDHNGDGVISATEWAFALSDFWFNSATYNAHSLLFGNLVD